MNTNIQAAIGTSSDLDWFRFNNTSSQRRIRIDLTTLPADYDVRLYRGTSTQVGISQNGGTTNEVIIHNTTTVATYYIRVYGGNSAFNTN
ncbi:MAG: pre-peptidase C-terminal domain-containing protein [Flavobacteriales bacterium]|nr:pre-peptidase C-terminal domain-containing protein [Flavobacteriales bacterium]